MIVVERLEQYKRLYHSQLREKKKTVEYWLLSYMIWIGYTLAFDSR